MRYLSFFTAENTTCKPPGPESQSKASPCSLVISSAVYETVSSASISQEKQSVGRERQSRDKVTESLPPRRDPSEPYKWGGISPCTYLCVFGKFGSPRDVLVEWKHQMNKLLCFAPSSCRNGPLEPSALTSDNMLCIQTRTLNTKVASVGPAACLLSRSPHFV